MKQITIKELKELSKSFSVLITDDEVDFLESFGKLAEMFFKKVYKAKNGLEALEVYKQNAQNIDILITDINMPKKNGIWLIDNVKEINYHIPVLVISAHSELQYFRELINLSVDGFVLKPIEEKQLFGLLYKICKNLFDELAIKKYQEGMENYLDSIIEKNIYFSKVTRLFQKFAQAIDKDSREKGLEIVKKEESEWRLLCDYIKTEQNKPRTATLKAPHIDFYKDKISATEYLESIEFDKYFSDVIEDITLLGDYASEIYELFENEIDAECFRKIGVMFEKYSSLLMMFPEFNNLSEATNCVSRFFKDNSFEFVAKTTDIPQLVKLVKHFMVDLENWKNSVFLQRNAKDIHYLDAQAKNFCETLYSLLQEPNQSSDNEDDDTIILF